MENILNFTIDELKNRFVEENLQAYRAAQIFGWIYKKFCFNFNSMSDLSKNLRTELDNRYEIIDLKLADFIDSEKSETVKFLFETTDGNFIEAVMILAEDENTEAGDSRMTLCVSSQAGCSLGCRFCATGLLGFKRNLLTSEIVSEILLVEKFVMEQKTKGKIIANNKPDRAISNIVFMGMGEPLLNYENVLKAISILNNPAGYNLGSRHFTLSTAGIISQIERLKNEKLQIRLAISLHSADQKKRETLMPVAKTNPLAGLFKAIKEYQKTSERRVTFEYVLIEGVNDKEEDVIELKKSLGGFDYNLNVIGYNEIEELPFIPPDNKTIEKFLTLLMKHGIPYVFRRSKGSEIKAGCGQLGLFWKKKTKKETHQATNESSACSNNQ